MAGWHPRGPTGPPSSTAPRTPRTLVVLAVLLLAPAALAGCLGDDGGALEASGADEGEADGDTASSSDAAQGSRSPSFSPPVNVTPSSGSEPVVATASDGTLFVQSLGSGNQLWRSTDGGASWTDVTPPVIANYTSADGFVAVGHDDTVYLANSDGGRLTILRSPDMGETWIPLAPPPVSEPMHRMWVVPTGDSTLHVLSEQLGPPHLWYMRSTDQGDTWDRVNLVDARTHFGSDLAVGPDGTLYNVRLDDFYGSEVPPASPGGAAGSTGCQAAESGWVLTASRDGGLTWETHRMFGSGAPGCDNLASSWQSLEVDEEGTLYFLWSWQRNGTSQVHLSTSHDGGETWSTPQALAPDRGAQALPWMDVRGPGEVGVTWYVAPVQGDTEEMDTPWFLEFARVSDADTADPTTRVTRVTPTPIHQGNICSEGPQCSGDEDRSLLDFTGVEYGPESRAHLAFAATEWGGDDASPVYAGQAEPLDLR